MLIVITGLPGSGKSYFTIRLAERLWAIYYNSDEIRKEINSSPSYSKIGKRKIYTEIFKRCRNNFSKYPFLIIDATFSANWTKQKLMRFAKETGIEIFIIEIVCEEKIIKERLKKKRKYSDADFGVYKKIAKKYSGFENKNLTLDSGKEKMEEMLKKTIAKLTNG